jgi:hypothetical protein
MSVLDELRAFEQRIEKRLRELAPMVTEYRDLIKVAERLGIRRDGDEPGSAAGEAPTASAGPASEPAGAASSKRRARGALSKRPAAPKSKAAASSPAATSSKAKAPARKSKSTPAKRAKPAAAGGTSAKPKPGARKRSAAAPGQREQDVLRVVGERPGVTVRELATELGVDATGLYGVVRRLEGKGQISKDGTQLRRIEAGAPTAEADIRTDAAPTTEAAAENSGRAESEPAAPAATAKERSS